MNDRAIINMLKEQIKTAVKILKSGGIVVYPTDTAYGLAVDATNELAVRKLYRLKGRDFKNPIHVIPPTKDWIEKLVRLDPLAKKMIDRFMPGPITFVLSLKARGKVWQLLSAGTKTLGIRRPKHKIALDLATFLGRPITTTSANVSGHENTYSVLAVREQFEKSNAPAGPKPDFYLDGGKLKKTKPSTVVSILNNHVKIIRLGPISEKEIKRVIK